MLVLDVVLLVKTGETIVGRFDLRSPHLDDIAYHRSWSLALPIVDWIEVLWTLLHAPMQLVSVTLKNEGLLYESNGSRAINGATQEQ